MISDKRGNVGVACGYEIITSSKIKRGGCPKWQNQIKQKRKKNVT